jgi:hypothetical protein
MHGEQDLPAQAPWIALKYADVVSLSNPPSLPDRTWLISSMDMKMTSITTGRRQTTILPLIESPQKLGAHPRYRQQFVQTLLIRNPHIMTPLLVIRKTLLALTATTAGLKSRWFFHQTVYEVLESRLEEFLVLPDLFGQPQDLTWTAIEVRSLPVSRHKCSGCVFETGHEEAVGGDVAVHRIPALVVCGLIGVYLQLPLPTLVHPVCDNVEAATTVVFQHNLVPDLSNNGVRSKAGFEEIAKVHQKLRVNVVGDSLGTDEDGDDRGDREAAVEVSPKGF